MSFALRLDPADTIAIGDGRPFNQSDSGRAIAASVFPPPPDTVYGAARVACARALGWDGTGNWSAEIARVIGDWNDPGGFSISGPYFRAGGADLLPIPSNVMLRIEGGAQHLLALKPGRELITDLGSVRLMDIPAYREGVSYEPLAGRWGKADAVLHLLAGETVAYDALGGPTGPLAGWAIDDLTASEPRVGITRVKQTRMVEEGQLYASVRRALRPGVEMLVGVDGPDWPEGEEVAVQLGGEARFAFADAVRDFTPPPEPSGTGRYLVYLATPAVLEPPVPGALVSGLSGRLVMASITGVASHSGRVGNTGGKGQRQQSKLVLPAGSVLFMEGNATNTFPARLGEKPHMGYGKFITGVWA